MKQHNLGTVITFEVQRTLQRRSFWAMTLAIPLLMVALITLITFSSTQQAGADSATDSTITFTYTDASGLVDPAIARTAGGTLVTDADTARADVIAGRAELFVAYPASPAKSPIVIVARDRGLASSAVYGNVARAVLLDSAREKVPDAEVAAALSGNVTISEALYEDGRLALGWESVILPALFLVLFYMTILMLGSQMLNITVEEKENRVTEMILTTIHPTTLIVGKIIALVVIGCVQGLVLVGTLLLLPSLATTAGGLPSGATGPDGWASLPELTRVVNPGAIVVGAVLFLGAFLLFTGLLVSVGAIMPTAKDAGSAFGVLMIGLFLPFYAIGLLMTSPHSVASEALTFFPLTAPVAAMARNALGNLDPWEAVLSIVVINASAVAFLALGIRLFRTGSISYNVRLDPRKALRSRGN